MTGNDGSTGEPTEPPAAAELSALTAADLRRREVAGDISRIVAAIARTEDQVAEHRERYAADVPARADSLRSQAADARAFAEHERIESRRWGQVADDADGHRPGTEDPPSP